MLTILGLFVVVPVVIVVVGNMIRIAVLNYLIVGPALGAAVAVAWASLYLQVQQVEALTLPALIICAVAITGMMELARSQLRIDVRGTFQRWTQGARRRGGYRHQARRALRKRYAAEVERA